MAQINVKIDEEVKRLAEDACAEMGLSISAAINVYLIKIGREKRIPFEISVDPFYSERNMERLLQSIERVRAGQATLKEHELFGDDDD